MTKKLFSKKQKQSKSETTEPTQPSEAKRSNILLKLLGWFAFMAVLSLGCFLLYPELASSRAPEIQPTNNIIQIQQEEAVSNMQNIQSVKTNEIMPPTSEDSIVPTTASTSAPSLINQQEKIEDQKQQIEVEENLPKGPIKKRLIARPRFMKKTAEQYTVLNALDFKNALLSHKNCRKHVESLLQIENPTDIMEKVIVTFLPYCLHQDTEREDVNIFLAHKKQAILSLFQQKHSTITAYFYALPWLVMDIHKVQPETDKPMDVLDRLHVAILENDTETALAELNKLPPRIGSIFNDVRQQLLDQQHRLSVLDELIISLANKGE